MIRTFFLLKKVSSDIKIKTHIIVQSMHSSLHSESKIGIQNPNFFITIILKMKTMFTLLLLMFI